MTRDFIDQLTEAFDKEGYEYILLYSNNWQTGAGISSSVEDLEKEYTFPAGRTITKRESLVELLEFALDNKE